MAFRAISNLQMRTQFNGFIAKNSLEFVDYQFHGACLVVMKKDRYLSELIYARTPKLK